MPYELGGMQKHSYYLAKYLAKEKVKVTLFHCITDKSKPLPTFYPEFSDEERVFLKIKAFHFPKSFPFPGHYLYNSFRFAKYIYEAGKSDWPSFDFIYAKGFTGWKLLIEKKKGKKLPPIGVKFHGMNMFYPGYSLKNKWENALLKPFTQKQLKWSDFVFSYGGKVTDVIEKAGVPTEKIIEVPTGVESAMLRTDAIPPVKRPLKCFFVGRNDPVKGIVELNSAMKYFANSSEIEFHIVGPFGEEEKVSQPNITYHGIIKDQQKLLSLMDEWDALLLPSHSEGMPNVVLEAMARGCTIIATRVGAVELLVDEKNGLLLNHSNELTSALKKVLSISNEAVFALESTSVKKVQNQFIWEKIVSKLVKILAEKSAHH